ncbi:MAG TPA: DUF6010 family protein [Aridibacter sp.]|nr:DUF6010 family protein [Aridibacter sp.]
MTVNEILIEIVIGAAAGAAVIAPFVRLGKASLRRFFAAALFTAAIVYAAFALAGILAGTASNGWFWTELFGVALFAIPAYFGYRGRAWLLSLGWFLHLFWDTGLHGGPGTSFVPDFYPGFCVGFDLVFAAFIAYYFYFRERV